MSEAVETRTGSDDASARPVSRARPSWLRKGLKQSERNWVTTMRNLLEANGFGDRRTSEYRARRALFYRRLAEHELDAIAEFGAADYERGWAFLEETARLASQRPEDKVAEPSAGPPKPFG